MIGDSRGRSASSVAECKAKAPSGVTILYVGRREIVFVELVVDRGARNRGPQMWQCPISHVVSYPPYDQPRHARRATSLRPAAVRAPSSRPMMSSPGPARVAYDRDHVRVAEIVAAAIVWLKHDVAARGDLLRERPLSHAKSPRCSKARASVNQDDDRIRVSRATSLPGQA